VPRVVLASARDLSTDGKVASKRFTRSARLTEAKQYKRVFAGAARRGDRYFTVLSVPNDAGQPRLGVVVARRTAPRAVDRNRIKRLVRESFRHHQQALAARDLVVLAKADARRASKQELADALARHWQRLRPQ
jgi:ribonuclease P protein component